MQTNKRKSPRLSTLAAAITFAGAATAFLPGCSFQSGKDAVASPSSTGIPVTSALAIEREVMETQEFSGRLEAVERVEIRSRVAGYVTAINFKPGSEVKKGDVLFVIDPRPYQAEAERADSAAAAALAKADLARIELRRAGLLLADKAIAQREYDEKASTLRELEAAARGARAQRDAAHLNLAYTRVLAPISGRVSKEEVTLGNLVDASALLTSLVSTDRVYASFSGDEDTYLRVARQARIGSPVAVRVGLANENGFPHEGTLQFIDNQLDADTGSVRMRAVFRNADQLLAPGLFARVQVDSGSGDGGKRRVVLINDRAVGTDQDRKFVVVVRSDGKAERRTVSLGGMSDGLRIVRDGLKPAEQIVLGGLQRVRPGDAVSATVVDMMNNTLGPLANSAAATGRARKE